MKLTILKVSENVSKLHKLATNIPLHEYCHITFTNIADGELKSNIFYATLDLGRKILNQSLNLVIKAVITTLI